MCIYARRDIPFWNVWRTCGSPFITRTKALDFIQALLRSILRHGLWTLLMYSLSHLFCKWHCVSLQACPRSPEWSRGAVKLSKNKYGNENLRTCNTYGWCQCSWRHQIIITRRSLVKSKVNLATSYTASNFVSLAKARFCIVSIRRDRNDRQWSHCELYMVSEHPDKYL